MGIKKKVVTGEDGQPIVTEEVTEEEIPETIEVSLIDENESTIEGVVRPVITEVKEDATTEAEIIIKEIVDKDTIPGDEVVVDGIDNRETKERKKKRVIKKRKVI